jgi:hypothetical protein
MAFDADEKAELIEVTGRNGLEIDVQLAAFSESITSSIETKVRLQLDRYYGRDSQQVRGATWFEGTESNEGFNMSAPNTADTRNPKEVIEGLLFFESDGGGYQIGLERG